MNIVIETIEHAKQAYPTSGNWWYERDKDGDITSLEIRVSDMGNWRYEALVGIHEAVEALLCRDLNIPEEVVSAFDKEFEHAREHEHSILVNSFYFRDRWVHGDAEPGDQFDAPYFREHQTATVVEKIVAEAIGAEWRAYTNANNALYPEPAE